MLCHHGSHRPAGRRLPQKPARNEAAGCLAGNGRRDRQVKKQKQPPPRSLEQASNCVSQMSAPASRPVHPCVSSLTEGARGAEYSTWAYCLPRRKGGRHHRQQRHHRREGNDSSSSSYDNRRDRGLPNLVTASASTVNIYSVEPASGKLRFEHCFSNLAGSVIFLASVASPAASADGESDNEGNDDDDCTDVLILGFAGHPRLSVVQVRRDEDGQLLLRAISLLDLSQAVQDASYGAITVWEQDAVLSCLQSNGNNNNRSGTATVACVLGGGVAVAVVEIAYHKSFRGWAAHEPYILPLVRLSANLPHNAAISSAAGGSGSVGLPGGGGTAASSNLGLSMSTGFGDIISSSFLSGYLEPVLVLLHSVPGGRTFPGRLGRSEGDAGAPPLYVTALSVGVTHQRTALLWCLPVPSDAFEVTCFGDKTTTCVVLGVNSIAVLDAAAGTVQSIVAVNGFALATCPRQLHALVQCNPLAKLALSLDGCALAWISPHSAFVALRTGQVYVLQELVESRQWTILPTGMTLGGVGEVEHMTALPLEATSPALMKKITGGAGIELFVGLLFAGSRLGNSMTLGYAVESVKLKVKMSVKAEEDEDGEQQIAVKEEMDPSDTKQDDEISSVSRTLKSEYDRVLKLEEDALYAPVTSTADQQADEPDVVPPSDDEVDSAPSSSKRQRLPKFTVVRGLTALDTLTNLGPIGPSCLGPVSAAPSFLKDEVQDVALGLPSEDVFGTPALVFPAGFGSSGGIAVATLPGRDDRMMLAEQDCVNVDCVFSLSATKVVLLGMSPKKTEGGIRVLRLTNTSSEDESSIFELNEVSIDDWSDGAIAVADNFQGTLHGAAEFSIGAFAMLVSFSSYDGVRYVVVVFEEKNGKLDALAEVVLDADEGDTILQTSPFVYNENGQSRNLSFLCLWSSGKAQIFSVSADGQCSSKFISSTEDSRTAPMDVDGDENDEEENELKKFYSSARVVSVDLFKAPKSLFVKRLSQASSTTVDSTRQNAKAGKLANGPGRRLSIFDEDDEDLYGLSSHSTTSTRESARAENEDDNDEEESMFAAICRQSGLLQVYDISNSGDPQLCWTCFGCGHGVMQLAEQDQQYRLPKSRKVSVLEMRFFWCGPSQLGVKHVNVHGHHLLKPSFCLALETSSGDTELYVAQHTHSDLSARLWKSTLRTVARQSQEQARHHTKLVRKKMVSKSQEADGSSFSHSRLHRFHNVSGQDGLFAATARPMWFVAERGRPTHLLHRTRHAAPAGGAPRPVTGFCSGLINPKTGAKGGFLTLHERVGRIGSQRLTAFHGLSKVFSTQGLLSGGLGIEKIPMGVTVRRIQFINDDTVSTGDHPLYAVLVSREIDGDQRAINSDGLTAEERERQREEKEAERVRKQVDADLGGFDIETEWVEEIEREDCFEVETDLGGAPPIREEAYALWIVDASTEKWVVVDSFELEDFEHGMTMKVVHLSEFKEDYSTRRDAKQVDDDEDLPKRLFVAVGTGYVDHNGEDVSSKGRMLLFSVTKSQAAGSASLQTTELSLAYEKTMYQGPVSTLSLLSVEGRNRIVIGAGPDVNISQWGLNKALTQVGFFRATMQILDIMLFKNFFLLSDAYDSLYFLVYRESGTSPW